MTEQNLRDQTIRRIDDNDIYVHIGGPDEDIGNYAEDFGVPFVVERDHEGRYVRNYRKTVSQIVSGFASGPTDHLIGCDTPDICAFASAIRITLDDAQAARDESNAEELPLCVYQTLTQSLVAHMTNYTLLILHHADNGRHTATERFHVADRDALNRICEATATVFGPRNVTREAVENAARKMVGAADIAEAA